MEDRRSKNDNVFRRVWKKWRPKQENSVVAKTKGRGEERGRGLKNKKRENRRRKKKKKIQKRE